VCCCLPSLETTAGKKLLDTLRHNAAQRSWAEFEALLIGADVTVEVLLECLVENGGFRVARAINSRGIAYPNARIRRAVMGALISKIMGDCW
jgi:hypothetical protein